MAQANSDSDQQPVQQQSRDGPRPDNATLIPSSVSPRNQNTTQGDPNDKQPPNQNQANTGQEDAFRYKNNQPPNQATNNGQEDSMNGRGRRGGNRGGNRGGRRGGGSGSRYNNRGNRGNSRGNGRGGNGQNTQGRNDFRRNNNARTKGGGGGRKNNQERKPGEKILHVSAQSPVKQVAGAIAWISREGECPRILATAAPAINQAVKACAIARQFMQSDKIEISVYPEYTRGRRRDGDSFTFDLRKTVTRYNVVVDESLQELKVSKESKAPTVAGAIAGRVREGQRVILSAIGPLSVAAAVRSVAIARQYLAEDGVDISFRPSFMNIEFDDGRKSSCLNFQLLAQQV